MKLCTDCKYYKAESREEYDICTHEKAQKGGVRSVQFFTCQAMRFGICEQGKLFEAKEAQTGEYKITVTGPT